MSDRTEPDEARETDGAAPSGRQALLSALDVPRYARLSVATGVAVAVGVTVLFVGVFAGWNPQEPAPYYLGLAFVVFVSISMLAGAVLVGRRALHLAVAPASIVRRSATGGVLAGLGWLVGGAALAAGFPPRGLPGLLLPWAALLTPFGAWAVHTRYKRTTRVRPVAAVGALLSLPGALVLANLAALELPALAAGSASGPAQLLLGGVALLAGGHLLQAVAAVVGRADAPDAQRWLPLLLGGGPVAGAVVLAVLGPGREALAATAIGFGLPWLVVCWRLRSVSDDEVPAPEPEFTPA